MKVYRAIGTFFSSLLIIVLVLLLVTSLLVVSIAQCVSKNTISDITKTILSNESIKEEISAGISQALTDMMQNVVSKPETGNNTQSSQTGATVPGGIPSSPSENENKGDEYTEQTPEKDITIAVSQERISEILSMPAVQDAVSDLVSEYAMIIIEQKEEYDVSCSRTIESMLADNASAFNEQIGYIVTDCNMTYDDFYDTAVLIANEADLDIPDKGASYVAILISIIGQKSEEIDQMLEDVLAQVLPATDHAETIVPTAALRSLPVMAATVTISLDTESPLELVSDVLEILQNPKIYAAIFALVMIFFLVTALFTWSFKRPLLFIGIASVLTAVCMFVITCLPIPYDMIAQMLAESLMPENVSLVDTMRDVVITTWSSACDMIQRHSLSALVIGVFCFVGFGILCSISKKKTQPQTNLAPSDINPVEHADS